MSSSSKIQSSSKKLAAFVEDIRRSAESLTPQDIDAFGGDRKIAEALIKKSRDLVRKIEYLRRQEPPLGGGIRGLERMMQRQIELLESIDKRVKSLENDVALIKRTLKCDA